MRYENLPIYKSALDFCAYIETIVKGFEKYSKYSIGQDLREYSKQILFLIHRANRSEDKKDILNSLVEKCEETKMLLQLAKELKSFSSFKSFEHSTKLCIDVCKQAQAWFNYFEKKRAGVLK
ncbi:MAG: four helix bundle protein [Campylobacterales bacterium]|nr:four helix bundle protein [Campylobacterales bacterium]